MAKEAEKPFNLFVYGTLMSSVVFRAVLGRRLVFTTADADNSEAFLARQAELKGYKKISPDNTYLYADNIHITPVAQRMIGNYAYTFLRSPKGW